MISTAIAKHMETVKASEAAEQRTNEELRSFILSVVEGTTRIPKKSPCVAALSYLKPKPPSLSLKGIIGLPEKARVSSVMTS